MKKIFATLMAACLLAAVLCVAVFAADEPAPGVVLRVSAQKGDDTLKLGDYTSFESGWEAAIDYAEDHDAMEENGYDRIVVDLFANWNAEADGDLGNGGDGFEYGAIHITEDTRITLNLNGHTINRALTTWKWNGEVIYIDDNADVIINDGKITGGWSGGGAGGIHIEGDATVELNDLHIVGNKTDNDDGGGIAISGGATLTMKGGSLEKNMIKGTESLGHSAYYGGAVYVQKGTAIFEGVAFKENYCSGYSCYGSALYADDSKVTLDSCTFEKNGPANQKADRVAAESVVYAGNNSLLTVKNSTFQNNGGKYYAQSVGYSSLFTLNESMLSMQGATVKNNLPYFLIKDVDDSWIFVSETEFVDNESAVFRGDSDTSVDSFFEMCTFNNNNGGDFASFHNVLSPLTIYDCDMGNTTYQDAKNIKFVETDAPNGAASIFGEGSLTMIISLVALIASVAAIVVNLSSKRKTVSAGAASHEKDEE